MLVATQQSNSKGHSNKTYGVLTAMVEAVIKTYAKSMGWLHVCML